MSLINRIKNSGNSFATRPLVSHIALAWLGSSLAIAAVAVLGQYSGQPLILGSFGASCVLLFGFPDAVFSQSRNVIIGHALCSLIGLCFLKFVGPEWWSMAIAVGTALAAMLGTRTVHPPAGSNPVIIFLTQPDWQFLLFPTLAGASGLFFLARLFQRMTRATG
ncbi:HPP family protein [Candidatus Methylobacter oryzae]|uniref:HPP family protein n=1 Tax=Candidatus Methylobacter oryzae TaxID=2497749 RepID=A0ABY3C4G6_9GAMM|nr:HPP family protein [Candidatus Methylobacter oryzae]TRW89601.1 HPP family protein [Candidatus Methylobacter oryzae]